MDHRRRKRYKTERAINLALVFIGVAAFALNLFALAEAIEKNDNFSTFRRIIYVAVFGGITLINYFRYRRLNRVLRIRQRQERMQHG